VIKKVDNLAKKCYPVIVGLHWPKKQKVRKVKRAFMQIHSARHRLTWFLAGKRKISKGIAAFLALSLVTSLGGIRPAFAATEPYAAQVSPGAVTMAPGESKQITLKF
jgi:hypothetical protein